MKLQSVSLKEKGEIWVRDQIANDPSIWGLGDVILKDKERRQPQGGRLDLLLQDQDPDELLRYEVELQLGPTDESHIIRTIEYWDVERKRYPQYEHVAVIVAEDIVGRFLNVISLFNGTIPLIALKMTGYKVGDEYALTFVKVLDVVTYGLVEEDEPTAEPADRAYWESKSSKRSLEMIDRLLQLVNQVEPKAQANYVKRYIGLKIDGSPFNFVSFIPKKAHVIVNLKLPSSEEVDALIDDAGFGDLENISAGEERSRQETYSERRPRSPSTPVNGLAERSGSEAYQRRPTSRQLSSGDAGSSFLNGLVERCKHTCAVWTPLLHFLAVNSLQ
jgi:hypothetical protein